MLTLADRLGAARVLVTNLLPHTAELRDEILYDHALWLHPEHQAFRERVRRFVFSPCAYCGGCERSLAHLEDCFGHTSGVCGRRA